MNVASWKDLWSRFSGRGIYPHQLAVMLLLPLRRIILSPEKLLAGGRRSTRRLHSRDGVALPFRSGTFDVAFLVAVLGEVSDPRACLASIADVLRPRGILVVVELPGDPDALDVEQLRALSQGSGLDYFESMRVSRAFLATFRREVKHEGTTAA